MDVFIDQPREVLRQRVFELHAVLDVIIREGEPVVLFPAAGLDQIGPQPDRRQIRQAHRRDCQNSNRDSYLGHDRGSHWGMLLPARLSHHCEGQLDNPAPDARRKHLPEEGDILVGETPLAVTFEVPRRQTC